MTQSCFCLLRWEEAGKKFYRSVAAGANPAAWEDRGSRRRWWSAAALHQYWHTETPAHVSHLLPALFLFLWSTLLLLFTPVVVIMKDLTSFVELIDVGGFFLFFLSVSLVCECVHTSNQRRDCKTTTSQSWAWIERWEVPVEKYAHKVWEMDVPAQQFTQTANFWSLIALAYRHSNQSTNSESLTPETTWSKTSFWPFFY